MYECEKCGERLPEMNSENFNQTDGGKLFILSLENAIGLKAS